MEWALCGGPQGCLLAEFHSGPCCFPEVGSRQRRPRSDRNNDIALEKAIQASIALKPALPKESPMTVTPRTLTKTTARAPSVEDATAAQAAEEVALAAAQAEDDSASEDERPLTQVVADILAERNAPASVGCASGNFRCANCNGYKLTPAQKCVLPLTAGRLQSSRAAASNSAFKS